MVGAYAIAGANSGGDHRMVEETVEGGPSTIVYMANYCTRASPTRVVTVPNISVIINARSQMGVLRCVRRCGRRQRPVGNIKGVVGGHICRRLSIPTFASQAHTSLGVRRNYGGFYAFYVVP